MKKKWENPIVNVLGVSDTEYTTARCLGVVDVDGDTIKPCTHIDDVKKIFNSDINDIHTDSEFIAWKDSHKDSCGGSSWGYKVYTTSSLS